MSRHRGSTTPMDFEWSNQRGPVDEHSPFLTAAKSNPKKRKLSASSPAPFGAAADSHVEVLKSGPPFGHPDAGTVLESPSKSGFSTPTRPNLVHSQTFPLAQGQKPLPSIPSHVQNSSAWEPRTPTSVYDASSGGETPNTPGQDSETATPDTQMASKMSRLMSPKKGGKRGSWLKMFSSSPSPSKEEPRKYSKKSENRVTKRRSKRSKEVALRDDADSDNEQGSKTVSRQEHAPAGFAAHIPGFFAWIEAHPRLPSVLSYYMQFAVNVALGGLAVYIIFSMWMAVRNDINLESDKMSIEIMKQMAVCAHHYRDNNCENNRAPALRHSCHEWEACMNMDAKSVARASVGARTFAMIFNAFVEEFSYKSMVFILLFFFVWLFVVFKMPRLARAVEQDWQLQRQLHASAQQAGPFRASQEHFYPAEDYQQHHAPNLPALEQPRQLTAFADPTTE